VEAMLRQAAPAGADVEIELRSSAEPGLVQPDAPAVTLALDVFEREFGRRPALVRSGGTLPIVPALAEKGIATILTGFALPDSNAHAPNERLLVESVPRGIEVSKSLYRAFAALA
ncbi:MAG: M20/M25/M40 family metallo-hydrolase, partial [Actinomycetota bacterium]|nr:M20/M25/M40 family metallo-hydrolase [Actinomycetota bacterium]